LASAPFAALLLKFGMQYLLKSAPPLYGYLQTESKKPPLPLSTGLDRSIAVHQIHLFDILHVNIKLHFTS
jgi:hypothetical protein